VIRFRAALLALAIGLVVVALAETRASPTAQSTAAPPQPTEPTAPTEQTAPTERPTRVPLPTLAPEVIVSRISRQTPQPLPGSTPPAEPRVEVVDYGFSPGQLIVHVGETVTFVNQGSDGHDVTGSGPGGDWRSGPLAPSERYTRAFGLPGTYAYECTIHPEMRGRVVVQP
jgi:plastocyanin